jgi:hypothetical protein
MSIIEEHCTPDGLFRFIVERGDDGDISLGVDGFPAHTHGDILASLSGLPIHDAVRDYIDRLLTGRSLIGIATVSGRIRDVWVTEDPGAGSARLPYMKRDSNAYLTPFANTSYLA